MKLLNLVVVFVFAGACHDAKAVEHHMPKIIKTIDQMTGSEIYQVSKIAERAGVSFRQMIDDRVLELLVVVSQRGQILEEVIVGSQGCGWIFFIGNMQGQLLDRVDPELLTLAEQACKSSGAKSICCFDSLSTHCLTRMPGYRLRSQAEGSNLIVKDLEG